MCTVLKIPLFLQRSLFKRSKTVSPSTSLFLSTLRFVGDITQTVPLYSAVKVGGRRLSDLVRSGENPIAKTRKVHIDSIEIQNFKPSSLPEVELIVKCRKGTYIRSLCHELAQALCRQDSTRIHISNRWRGNKAHTYRVTRLVHWDFLFAVPFGGSLSWQRSNPFRPIHRYSRIGATEASTNLLHRRRFK